MAEPVDYFMQGVGLGQRSRSIRNQEEQFRTNLAERARQANEQLDLRRRQVDSQISRDNLYIRKLDFDLETATTNANRETTQLKLLGDYQAAISDFDLSDTTQKLPLPPQGLTGAHLQSAILLRENIAGSQKELLSYKIAKEEEDEFFDLTVNHGLPKNYLSLPPENQNIALDSARRLRAKRRAVEIASEMGLTIDDLRNTKTGKSLGFLQGVTAPNTSINIVEAFYNPETGDLEEDLLKGELMPLSPFEVKSKQEYSTGTTVENLARKLTKDQKKSLEIATLLKSFGSSLYIKDEMGEEKINPIALQQLKQIDPNMNFDAIGGDTFESGFQDFIQNQN